MSNSGHAAYCRVYFVYLFCILYIFHRVLSHPYSDILYSEECQKKKLYEECCDMLVFQSHFQFLYSQKIVNSIMLKAQRGSIW